MMKRNPYLIFFFLLLIPFLVYFARPDFIGNDTYGFLLLTCQQNNAINVDGIVYFVFSVLPCSFIGIKVLLFALAFFAGCFCIKLATLFSPENGWRASYLLFLSSVTVLEFAKLENDQFAFPFLFASVYFFFHGFRTGKRLSYILCFLCWGIAGLFWYGAIFYLFAFAFHVLILAIVSVVFLYFFGRQLLGIVIRTEQIMEDMPFKFHIHLLLNFGIGGLIYEPLLLPAGVFFFILGSISAKFWILSLPFLVTGMVLLLEGLKIEWLYPITTIISILLVFGLAQSIWLNPPTQDHWNAIGYAMVESDGKINNDWGMGYWVKFVGGETESFASMHHQQDFNSDRIVVSERDLNCLTLNRFGSVRVYSC